MSDNMLRELVAVQMFQERTARVLCEAWVAEALGGAGAREDAERARRRRERVARLLKALAFRIAPPTARAEWSVGTAMTPS